MNHSHVAAPPRWRRASGFVRPQRGAVLVVLVASLATAAISAVEPLVLKWIFDGLADSNARDLLLRPLALLVVLLLAKEIIGAFVNWLTWRTRLRVHHRLLAALVTRLHSLPASFHVKAGVGATMTRMERGIQGLLGAFNNLITHAAPAIVYLVITLIVMVQLDWRLALVVLAFAPLPALIATRAAPTQVRRERRLLDAWAQIYARFNEVLHGIQTVRSFAREDHEKQLFLSEVARANGDVERGVRYDSGVSALQNLAVIAARAVAIGVGATLVVQGEISVGTLVAFLGYVVGVFGPVQGLTGLYSTLRAASVSLDTILELLDTPDTLADRDHAIALPAARGEIRFTGVQFSYGAERRILDGLDLHIEAGERVALVGPSGAGKSTLLALMQRFHDPDHGRVTIDGHDLRDLAQASLRRQIGVVLQDPLLFNDTIAANIAYGRPEASFEEIARAARLANIEEMIEELPDRYQTLAGERGARLSMGERQRVAIARAIVKDPPILILDEATSALDAESEALVQEALERLTRGKTTLIVAHRLSTVVHADRIVVLRRGRIEEQGNHATLVNARGYYAGLVDRQVGKLLA